jgi:hypothetical protein
MGEWARISKKMAVAFFKALFRYSGGDKENHG